MKLPYAAFTGLVLHLRLSVRRHNLTNMNRPSSPAADGYYPGTARLKNAACVLKGEIARQEYK